MKICDFVKPEIETFLAECNFTNDEKELFLLRTKDVPLERCAEIMNLSISATRHKSAKLNKKIAKIMLL